MSHRLESDGSSGQFEYPHHSGNPQHLHDAAHVSEHRVLLFFLFRILHRHRLRVQLWGRGEEQVEIVRSDGETVNNVHCSLEELDLVRAAGQANKELDGEVGDADRLHEGQLGVVHRLPIHVHDLHPGESVEAHPDGGDQHQAD